MRKITKYISVLSIVFVFVLISSTRILPNDTVLKSQKKLDFSGSNGLFIEYDNGLQIKWITNKADSGFIELRTSDNTIIKKEITSQSRSHSFKIDYNIKDPIILDFGSLNGSKQTLKLRKKSSLENAQYKNADSIFVVGDVHGRYDQLINLLQKSNLIDVNLNWIGGQVHLVFLGDLFDRGDDVTKVLWFIYELEEKANLKGGKVHLVLGNHEIMVMSKDLRYLSRKEASIPFAHGVTYDYLFHPNNSLLGAWLSSKPSVIKIDDIILAHGGVVDLGTPTINNFNKITANYMQKKAFLDLMLEQPDSLKYSSKEWHTIRDHFYHPDSPFWHRGYVYQDTLAPQLNAMLRKYNAKIHVVAHTPQETITQRYKGKLLTTDLNDAATELLLLVKNKKKYNRYKIDGKGLVTKVN